MRAIRIHENGDANVMKWEEVATPAPQGSEVLVKMHAAGVNFIDVYHRKGIYPLALPSGLGLEGSGVVEEVGAGAKMFRKGDRVAFSNVPGAYAEYVCTPEEKLVRIPDGVDFETAAACMLQGMTAHYLTHSTYVLKKGDTCVVHSAAGGAGLLLVQLAKHIGARVIGVVSTAAKAILAKEAGADEVIVSADQDFEVEVMRITGNKGVQVIYDGVGKDTFLKGLNCLAPLGMMALYGQSSGSVDAFDPSLLAQKGSLFLTRPVLFHYIAERQHFEERSAAVFNLIKSGVLKIRISEVLPMSDAAIAHEHLEGRKTVGKLLLSSAALLIRADDPSQPLPKSP